MNWNDNRNLTMLVDFYELTMSNGYFEQGCGDRLTVFDMFFRNFPMVTDSPSVPTRSSSLTMSRTFISPRRIPIPSGAKRSSTKKFLAYLEDFHFSGDIWAMFGSPAGANIMSSWATPRLAILCASIILLICWTAISKR